jgi:hypothetical protein
MSENENKSSKDECKRYIGADGAVSGQTVGAIRKGLVSGSNVQQVRNEIEQSKKPK